MCLYQGDYETLRKDALRFAKEKNFNGHFDLDLDARTLQENFHLITLIIENSANEHITSKTSKCVSLIAWIPTEIRRKIHRRNKYTCI